MRDNEIKLLKFLSGKNELWKNDEIKFNASELVDFGIYENKKTANANARKLISKIMDFTISTETNDGSYIYYEKLVIFISLERDGNNYTLKINEKVKNLDSIICSFIMQLGDAI